MARSLQLATGASEGKRNYYLRNRARQGLGLVESRVLRRVLLLYSRTVGGNQTIDEQDLEFSRHEFHGGGFLAVLYDASEPRQLHTSRNARRPTVLFLLLLCLSKSKQKQKHK